jgi:S-DNA-T family DNA segregation ATPase FtsK/SpoIIIE
VQFVFDDGHAERELQLHLDRPDACVADLADALNAAGPGLSIDGRIIPGELALSEAGLVTGARVEPAGQGKPPPPRARQCCVSWAVLWLASRSSCRRGAR